MTDWNTAAVRELLTAAFTDGELTSLCFDHFRPAYEEFSSGMGKGQKIQKLLDYCVRHDQLETLLRLVKEHNQVQYERFAPRLRLKATAEPTIPTLVDPDLRTIWQRRLNDLADNIDQDLTLLKEYEDALRYERDPLHRAKYHREIRQLRESAACYKQEYDELKAQVIDKPPEALRHVASQLVVMNRLLNPGCVARIGSYTIELRMWYRSLPAAQQVAIVVALIGLLGAVGTPVASEVVGALLKRPTPTPITSATVTPTKSPIIMILRVINTDTVLDIKIQQDGKVVFEFKGKADADGTIKMYIPPGSVGQEAELIIEAKGYERHVQSIPLVEGPLSEPIELKPMPTPTPIPTIEVTLKTYHGRYVTAMGSDRDWLLRAETNVLSDREKFTLLCLDDGKVAFETHHGRYVTAMDDVDEKSGKTWDWVLRAETQSLDAREKFALVESETEEELPCSQVFRLLEQGDVRIVLKTYHGRYVTAMNSEDDRNWVLRAETKTLSDWEKFTLNALTPNRQWKLVIQEFDSVEMVMVPIGCFMMGSESGPSDEVPVHEVCFDEPFWIDRYEVTNAQFAAFGGRAAVTSRWPEDNRPRVNITWPEARDFCISRGARLPTEAEWEYAAAGPESWTYPWGDAFTAHNAVYEGNSDDQTAEVGSKPDGVSWVGALDMSGNVWEWTSTLYWDYPYDPADGRETHTNTGELRVARGGAWSQDNPKALRTANRMWEHTDRVFLDIGFRCVRAY